MRLALRACIQSPSPFVTDSLFSPLIYSAAKRSAPQATSDAIKAALLDTTGPALPRLLAAEGNVRFRSFARAHFLAASFRVPHVAFQSTTPSIAALHTAFPELAQWNRSPSANDDARRVALQAEASAASSGSALSWSLQDALEAIGCAVAGTSAFNLWCELNGRYDVWTTDYVHALARRLGQYRTVLEVGAGDGRLAFLLQRALKDAGASTSVVAVDDGSWRVRPAHGVHVVAMDYARALNVYAPDAVVQAWMPMGTDFSRAFRAAPSVREYVLIGETDASGCCGHPWLTWGCRPKPDAPSPSLQALDVFDWLSRDRGAAALAAAEPVGDVAPYARDGFAREDLDALSALQWSRYDRALKAGNSRTVAFKRHHV